MKYVDEYRDADTARAVATGIAALCVPGRRFRFGRSRVKAATQS